MDHSPQNDPAEQALPTRRGFFTWLTLPNDAVDLARRAFDAKVAFVPGVPFFPDGRGARKTRRLARQPGETKRDRAGD